MCAHVKAEELDKISDYKKMLSIENANTLNEELTVEAGAYTH